METQDLFKTGTIIENPLISIIIPVYNVESYCNRCIESVVNQSYRNLEIILVDDGSSDACPQICDRWAERDSRIKVIHKVNGGLSDARNAGLSIAHGELIGFVDADDWIALELFQKLKAAIDNDQSDIAACTVEMVWEKGNHSRLLTVRENCVLDTLEAQRELLYETKLKQPVWYKLYRRNVIEKVRFETGKYHEDVYWSYQVVGNAKRVSLIDYIGYYYLQRKGSIMGNNYSLKRLDVMEAYCQRYEFIRKKFPSLEKAARRSILTNCIYHGQMAMRYLPKKDQNKAFSYLNQVKRRYPLKFFDYAEIKISQKLWLFLGQNSLRAVCRIKNVLKVGF